MKREYILYTLAVIQFTNIVDSMLIMPLGDIFIETFDITAAEFGFLVSIYAFAATFSALIAFFNLDKFDRKHALIFIYVGFGLATMLCAMAPTYEVLLAFRFIAGLFGGVIGALALSIISDLYMFAERGKAMGILMAAFSSASAFGVPFGLYLAAQGSWQTPFLILGISALTLSVAIIVFFPRMTGHIDRQKVNSISSTIQAITSDSNQMHALAVGFLIVLGHFMIIPFISPFLIKNVGLTQTDIALQFFLGGIATVVTAPFIGRLTDKLGVNKVFTTLMIVCFIPTMMITFLTPAPLPYVFLWTTLFFIFASGRFIPANTIITAAATPENRGSFMSLKSSLQQFAIGISALISGQIIFINDANQYENYPIIGGIAIVLGLIAIVYIRVLKVAKGN